MASIYQKLLEIQTKVKGLAKDKAADKYQYVSGSKVLDIIRPEMDRLGLLLVPEITSSAFTRQDYEAGKAPNRVVKSEMFCNLEMTFTWIDADTGEKLVCGWASSGMNNWDKGLGSAITYGERYFLLKFFHIATDYDDVDANGEIDEDNLAQVIAWVSTLTSTEQLNKAWQTYGDYYGKNKQFVTAFTKRAKEVGNGTR